MTAQQLRKQLESLLDDWIAYRPTEIPPEIQSLLRRIDRYERKEKQLKPIVHDVPFF